MVDAHPLLSLAALGTEASDRLVFLGPRLAGCRRLEPFEALRGLLLQLVGQVVEDACTVLHRLEERRSY